MSADNRGSSEALSSNAIRQLNDDLIGALTTLKNNMPVFVRGDDAKIKKYLSYTLQKLKESFRIPISNFELLRKFYVDMPNELKSFLDSNKEYEGIVNAMKALVEVFMRSQSAEEYQALKQKMIAQEVEFNYLDSLIDSSIKKHESFFPLVKRFENLLATFAQYMKLANSSKSQRLGYIEIQALYKSAQKALKDLKENDYMGSESWLKLCGSLEDALDKKMPTYFGHETKLSVISQWFEEIGNILREHEKYSSKDVQLERLEEVIFLLEELSIFGGEATEKQIQDRLNFLLKNNPLMKDASEWLAKNLPDTSQQVLELQKSGKATLKLLSVLLLINRAKESLKRFSPDNFSALFQDLLARNEDIKTAQSNLKKLAEAPPDLAASHRDIATALLKNVIDNFVPEVVTYDLRKLVILIRRYPDLLEDGFLDQKNELGVGLNQEQKEYLRTQVERRLANDPISTFENHLAIQRRRQLEEVVEPMSDSATVSALGKLLEFDSSSLIHAALLRLFDIAQKMKQLSPQLKKNARGGVDLKAPENDEYTMLSKHRDEAIQTLVEHLAGQERIKDVLNEFVREQGDALPDFVKRALSGLSASIAVSHMSDVSAAAEKEANRQAAVEAPSFSSSAFEREENPPEARKAAAPDQKAPPKRLGIFWSFQRSGSGLNADPNADHNAAVDKSVLIDDEPGQKFPQTKAQNSKPVEESPPAQNSKTNDDVEMADLRVGKKTQQ